jgi:lysophospholipase L1-like esterase
LKAGIFNGAGNGSAIIDLCATSHPLVRRAACFALAFLLLARVTAADLDFDFAHVAPKPGAIYVSPETKYDAARGFGFLPNETSSQNEVRVFALDLAEGNYDVTIKFGDAERATSTTIKAEQRRLMLEKVETKPGEFETRTFTVNLRKPPISTGGTTTLNARELGPPVSANWDEHLTLEFNGAAPGVAAMQITPAPQAATVFLAGDSTVTDGRREPWCGWGQMLPRFFSSGTAVSNHAESGLALHSFESQKRLAKILSMIKPGDFLFIQFGHNDQKSKAQDAGPFTTYAANLKRFIEAARSKSAIPVLVTPMERRRWEGEKPALTLADYAQAVRDVGKRENVPVIDLHAMSLALYAALGSEKSKAAFAHYPANTFPGQDKPLKDDTHHNAYGAYELARCVVQGVKTHLPKLAVRLAADTSAFDPAHPDAPETLQIPASPADGPLEKPAGS